MATVSQTVTVSGAQAYPHSAAGRARGARLMLIAMVLLWLAVDGWMLPPAFGGMDIYYFKDPGANLADGLGFVTRFTYGNPSLDYKPYAQYPPIYPFLYGLFAEAMGVSLRSNQIFNSLVNVACGLAGFYALQPALEAAAARMWSGVGRTLCTAGLLALCLVTGFIAPDADRPDALAVAVALSAFLVQRRFTGLSGSIVAGLLTGFSFFISPFVCIWAGSCIAIIIAVLGYTPGQAGFPVRNLLGFALAAGVMAALMLGLIALWLPGWFDAFGGVLVGRTTHNETGGGYFMLLLHGDLRGWAGAFKSFTRFGAGPLYVNLAKLAIADAAILVAAFMDLRRPRGASSARHGGAMLLLVLMSPLCLIITPYQFSYIRITALLLLGGAASLVAAMPDDSRRRYGTAVLGAFLVVCLAAAPRLAHDGIARIASGPSLGRAIAFIDDHRSGLSRDRVLLAVSPANYMLWRQEGLHPLNAVFSGFNGAQSRGRLAFVALGYSRSDDPAKPEVPEWFSLREFRAVATPRLPQVPRLFGRALQPGNATWESVLFRRRDDAVAHAYGREQAFTNGGI